MNNLGALCFADALLHDSVLAVILVGLLYGFFIAIICGQRINERHYHVLAKQELTKVSNDVYFLDSRYLSSSFSVLF